MELHTSLRRSAAPVALTAAVLLTASACGGSASGSGTAEARVEDDLSGTIRVDGSSTVAPLSTAAAQLFQGRTPMSG